MRNVFEHKLSIMISEGSFDSKVFSFPITKINCIFKYLQIDNNYFSFVITFHNITVVIVFLINKYGLIEHKRLLSPQTLEC